jgi:hypothetical protein
MENNEFIDNNIMDDKHLVIYKDNFLDKYYCNKCGYYTERKSQWIRHSKTKKHNNYNYSKQLYICYSCNMSFSSRTTMWRHSKNCISETVPNNNQDTHIIIPDINPINTNESINNSMKNNKNIGNSDGKYPNDMILRKKDEIIALKDKQIEDIKDMFLSLVEQNKELQNQVLELAKKPHITNIKTQNNINILNYLNTECKDAMNLSEFVKNFEITFDDLDTLRKNGIYHSIKTTFVKSLIDMEYNKRPIHCSDKKRKKFYVKEHNNWDKDEENKKIQSAIIQISNKQCKTLQKWKIHNPDWLDNDEKQENANMITLELSKIYEQKEKNKLVNDLTSLTFNVK